MIPIAAMGVLNHLPRSVFWNAFTAKRIRFQIADASGLIPIGQIMYEPPTRIARLNSIEIFVHRHDKDKARKIIGES
jgi:hypothetical protein